jgi:hypothetical protein
MVFYYSCVVSYASMVHSDCPTQPSYNTDSEYAKINAISSQPPFEKS